MCWDGRGHNSVSDRDVAVLLHGLNLPETHPAGCWGNVFMERCLSSERHCYEGIKGSQQVAAGLQAPPAIVLKEPSTGKPRAVK